MYFWERQFPKFLYPGRLTNLPLALLHQVSSKGRMSGLCFIAYICFSPFFASHPPLMLMDIILSETLFCVGRGVPLIFVSVVSVSVLVLQDRSEFLGYGFLCGVPLGLLPVYSINLAYCPYIQGEELEAVKSCSIGGCLAHDVAAPFWHAIPVSYDPD